APPSGWVLLNALTRPADANGPLASATWPESNPTGRTLRAAARHRQHRVHAVVQQPRDAHDAGPRVLLWRARRPQERARDHDPELRLALLDDGRMVRLRLLALLLGRRGLRDRQPRHGLPARRAPAG